MKKGLVQEGIIFTTLTACCGGCKDVFTVWAKVQNGRMYIEAQSRIKRRNGDGIESDGYISIPREGFFHHCGGRLKFYLDYILTNQKKNTRLLIGGVII